MSKTSGSQTSRDERLDQVIAARLKSLDAGYPLDQESMLADHPDLADELQSFFCARDELEPLFRQLRSAAFPEKTPANPFSGGAQGQFLADYELLGELGRGAMGAVYKVRHVGLNRVVALKTILAGQRASETEIQRFRQEAEAGTRVVHANIVPIYDIGEYDGQLYYTMKLIDGGSLRDAIATAAADKSGSVRDPNRAAGLIAVVARAVDHAHQQGVLHRDLKPGNILIDRTGEPHVADFGLAKRVDGDGGLTQSGAIVGTPNYMAPEQVSSAKQLTPAVDVYGLGAVLYETLTGHAPFQSDSALETLAKVRGEEPAPVRMQNPQVDRDLETICLKCLDKDPTRRYDSAAALADDLDRWSAGAPILARSATGWARSLRWARRQPLFVCSLLAMIATMIAFLIVAGLLVQEKTQRARADEERRIAESKVIEYRKTFDEFVDDFIARSAASRRFHEMLLEVLASDRTEQRH